MTDQNTERKLWAAVHELSKRARTKGAKPTVIAVARHAGVQRSLVYRDHRSVVDFLRRDEGGKLEEVAVLRTKVTKLTQHLASERERSRDLVRICAELICVIEGNKQRIERLENKLAKVAVIRPLR